MLVNVPDPYFSAESKGPLNCNQSTQFYCSECDLGFASGPKLGSHRFRVHGVRSTAHEFAGAYPMCSVCGMFFQTRMRRIAHLTNKKGGRSMTACLESLMNRGYPMANHVLAKLDEEDRTLERQLRAQGLRRTAAGKRCCRGTGPVLCGAELT